MADETKKIVNREYKDRLFKLIFQEKKDLLELYNAINDTDYDNPEEIEVNTMEDVVYMGMKNDISFLMKDVLNLYEHQSTFSPNLPLRGLFYFANLFRKIVGKGGDVYSSKRLELPFPQFVVFYNGTREEPERQVLHLHDSFSAGSGCEKSALDCHAIVLNINLGNNAAIMDRCQKLKEYAIFISCIKRCINQKIPIIEAVETAVSECIEKGILADILRDNREEVTSMLLTEYDEQAHIESERRIAIEEGKIEGIILAYRDMGVPDEEILVRLKERFGIKPEEAEKILKSC